MSYPSLEQLGPPSLRLAQLQLWVHGRESPASDDVWDGNWLRVTVVRVARSDEVGHLKVRVEITPDHLTQGHWFEFEIDQTYLPPVVDQLGSLLRAFPVRGI